MSVRNLRSLFRPTSIALVGASDRVGSVGSVLSRNLLSGGFEGPIAFVNPTGKVIEGVRSVPSVADLPFVPELAVVATPADSVIQIVDALGARGTRAVVVISAGFEGSGSGPPDGPTSTPIDGPASARGSRSAALLADVVHRHDMRLVGPNCIGILAPHHGVNASFSHLGAPAGTLAFIAQSGAIVTAVQDWAAPREIGFSHLVSLGDMLDVDFGDLLDFLANDPETEAILLYIEGIRDAREFMSAARAAARMKPVLAVKGGRFEAGRRAAASHTGAIAGSDSAYDAAFRRAGILRVHTLEELFGAVQTLATARRHRGGRLAILTNGGGLGVLAVDALSERGGRLAELSSTTLDALDDILPRAATPGNPVDVLGDASGERYTAALSVLLQDPGIDATLVLNCPTAVCSRTEVARAVARVAAGHPDRTILTAWVGAATTAEAIAIFAEQAIPSFDTPEQAIDGFLQLVEHGLRQDLLLETPPSLPEVFAPRTADARALVVRALEEGRGWLTEPEAKAVADAYGIPTVPTRTASNSAEAARIAAEIGGPVALKILSRDLIHKSDVGGVVLNLEGPSVVRETAERMERSLRALSPDARLDGFAVQPTVRRPGAREVILGMTVDATFGPVLVFGEGGTAVEVLGDTAAGLPPLNLALAREMMARTRIHRILEGYRDVPPANLAALALTLVKLSQLVVDLPEIVEIDLNPMLVDAYGVIALDARMRVARARAPGHDRLAIRPYPAELTEEIRAADGRVLLLRAILPEDEASLRDAFQALTPEEARHRFLVPRKLFDHLAMARFTQIDYDRDLVLVLTEPGVPGRTPIHGIAQISTDPDGVRAEFSLLVGRDVTGLGLGPFLLDRLVAHARSRGIQELYGDILSDNQTMLRLVSLLGFELRATEDMPSVIRARLDLGSHRRQGG